MSAKDESRDLEMYIKYAVLKFLQCVTYSRHNCRKMHTDSKILLGVVSADWFNLCIPDNSAILEEVKNLFGGKAVELSHPICIEIYLRTPDNEAITIEYWWIYKTLKTVSKDVCGKVTFYNSLTTLLKSLLLTTRATPGYAIARNQVQTSVKLHHHLYFGEPSIKSQENFKRHLIGVAPSPIGTIEIQVAWKNKLLLDGKSSSPGLEDTQFDIAANLTSNKNLIPLANKAAALVEDDILNPAGKKAAFGSPLDINFVLDSMRDEVPFSSLLKYANSPKDSIALSSPSDGVELIIEQATPKGLQVGNKKTIQNLVKTHEDFVMVEPNYPFASQEELIKFYQEFQDAPPLSMFDNDYPLEEPLEAILEQIARFEMNAEQINDFVNSLERLNDT